MACCDDPHCRSTVVPGTLTGHPAARTAVASGAVSVDGRSAFDLVHPEDREHILPTFLRGIAEGKDALSVTELSDRLVKPCVSVEGAHSTLAATGSGPSWTVGRAGAAPCTRVRQERNVLDWLECAFRRC